MNEELDDERPQKYNYEAHSFSSFLLSLFFPRSQRLIYRVGVTVVYFYDRLEMLLTVSISAIPSFRTLKETITLSYLRVYGSAPILLGLPRP